MSNRLSRTEYFLIFTTIIFLAASSVYAAPSAMSTADAQAGGSSIIATRSQALPFLPPEKSDIEQLLTFIEMQQSHTTGSPKSLLFFFFQAGMAGVCISRQLPAASFIIASESCDPIRKRIIKYIHDKEDHK